MARGALGDAPKIHEFSILRTPFSIGDLSAHRRPPWDDDSEVTPLYSADSRRWIDRFHEQGFNSRHGPHCSTPSPKLEPAFDALHQSTARRVLAENATFLAFFVGHPGFG
jgi:hypothetical protein